MILFGKSWTSTFRNTKFFWNSLKNHWEKWKTLKKMKKSWFFEKVENFQKLRKFLRFFWIRNPIENQKFWNFENFENFRNFAFSKFWKSKIFEISIFSFFLLKNLKKPMLFFDIENIFFPKCFFTMSIQNFPKIPKITLRKSCDAL